MSRLARPAGRLATGSSALVRSMAARAAAWCARGRRDDLTGWRAALGILVRLALLLLGAYLLARIVRALPALMWVISAGWTVAAWRAGRPAAEEPEEPPAETPPTLDRDAVQTLLLEAMGDAPAVHLRTVLAHLQERGQWEGRTVGDLRSALEALEIPVQPKVKVAGSKSPTRGVRRADLAPAPVAAQETSTTASTAA
ncbi:hypothetical protein [Streptomyces sp. YIM B13518]|uniref:hypothetical protein n=1 Tax=Streptomyces sp. YIM B13518 TaxID=3366316 RepID=UPI0036944BB6